MALVWALQLAIIVTASGLPLVVPSVEREMQARYDQPGQG